MVKRNVLEVGTRQIGALEISPLETDAGQLASGTFQGLTGQEGFLACLGRRCGNSANRQQQRCAERHRRPAPQTNTPTIRPASLQLHRAHPWPARRSSAVFDAPSGFQIAAIKDRAILKRDLSLANHVVDKEISKAVGLFGG